MGALKVATVVRRVVKTARADARWSPAHELTAVLALKVASRLDDTTSAGEAVRLTRELRSLMAELPDGVPVPPDPGGGEDDGDDIDRELADIVGSGPEMGHATHS
jgi:hypothetical protein